MKKIKKINLPMSLGNLSPDLKIVIATFLPAKTVFLHLALVSKSFAEMVNDYHKAKDIQNELLARHRETIYKTSQFRNSFKNDFQVAAKKIDSRCNVMSYFCLAASVYFAVVIPRLKNNEYHDYFYNGGLVVMVGTLGVSTYLIGKDYVSHWGRCIKKHYMERELKSSIRFLTKLSQRTRAIEKNQTATHKKSP